MRQIRYVFPLDHEVEICIISWEPTGVLWSDFLFCSSVLLYLTLVFFPVSIVGYFSLLPPSLCISFTLHNPFLLCNSGHCWLSIHQVSYHLFLKVSIYFVENLQVIKTGTVLTWTNVMMAMNCLQMDFSSPDWCLHCAWLLISGYWGFVWQNNIMETWRRSMAY